jgi:hypothetical protein
MDDDKTVDRRRLLVGAGVGGGGVALGLLGAGPAVADDRRNHPVVGSWVVTVHEAGTTQATTNVTGFALGGVITTVDIAPPGPPGVGAWRATGRSGFRGTFWQSALDDTGKPVGTVKIRVWGSAHGDHASGTFRAWVYDPTGKLLDDTGHGTFTAKRIDA